MSQAAAIPIASAPCMWELHGHVGRTDPCPSCPLLEPGAWPQPLLRVAALLQQELVLSPHPKELGVLQGSKKTRERPGRHKHWREAACIEQP